MERQSGGQYHKNSVNAMAEAPSATAACHIRESTTMEPNAALLLALAPMVALVDVDGFAEVAFDVVDAVVVGVREVVVVEVVDVAEMVLLAEDDTEDGPGTAPDGVEEFTPAGGGTAVEGSTRAPTPHAIGAFVPGWLGFGGGVVAPVGEAMVNRVVHVLSVASGAVNW